MSLLNAMLAWLLQAVATVRASAVEWSAQRAPQIDAEAGAEAPHTPEEGEGGETRQQQDQDTYEQPTYQQQEYHQHHAYDDDPFQHEAYQLQDDERTQAAPSAPEVPAPASEPEHVSVSQPQVEPEAEVVAEPAQVDELAEFVPSSHMPAAAVVSNPSAPLLHTLASDAAASALSSMSGAIAALLSVDTIADAYSLMAPNASESSTGDVQLDHPLVASFHSLQQALLDAWQQSDFTRMHFISNNGCVSEEGAALGVALALVVFTLLYTLYYYTYAAQYPTLYTQHASAGARGVATQLPPVRIDTSLLPALQAVEHAVSPSSRLGHLLQQRYKPTAWATAPFLSGHLQTVLTAKATPWFLQTPLVTYKRELLPVAAGSEHTLAGQVALDWAVLGKARSSRAGTRVNEWHAAYTDATPTVIICHGLAGGSAEHYVKNTVFKLSQPPHNFRCVVFNARGCGKQEIISPQLYCGAYTDDLRQVVANLHARLPRAPLLAVGFSLGANILTKFVGEEGLSGRPAPFTAAVAVANPFDFLHGARHLDSNIVQRYMYSRTLAANLIALFKTHMHVLDRDGSKQRELDARQHQSSSPSPVAGDGVAVSSSSSPLPPRESWDLGHVFSSPSLREFDKRLTRIVFGYATVDDYYRDASSARFVKFINTPTLFINAIDDPISSPVAIPYDECSINPFVTLITTPTGGHSMDHFQGNWKLRSWSVRAIAAFLADITRTHGAVGNQARAEPICTPPPAAEALADSIDGLESWLPASSAAVHPSNGLVPFTPSAPSWGVDTTDIAASIQEALELQERLNAMEAAIEEAEAEAKAEASHEAQPMPTDTDIVDLPQ